MKVSKFNQLFTQLSLFSLLVVASFSTSCNKEAVPIVLTGNWDLDTAGVMVYIVYSPEVALEYPNSVKFLGDNIQKIRKELMKPNIITFKISNIVECIYNNVPLPVKGTFVQENAVFTITNGMFPEGIAGASDGLRLELYYNHEYLMSILYKFLTEEDDSPAVYDKIIERFEGVGAYRIGK